MTICLSPVSRFQSVSFDLKNPQPIPYQVAVQVKYLHLEAEIESLLYQLQSLNKQRLATSPSSVQE
ncbi:hypothetical protein [Chlorogloea sp. CCALA 695]|uniref:hypothetical protein n=1 Tax=Chlorogloea sp. CCALA 695 TaxID=2107693 RepID=UPI000D05EDF5|nr:hypothetical protein [Chlorogloea sp. CCALA 695]PSB34600.1 hypothetical protein C7B70_03870 [Chlorogloea sp. CCALA 695]